MKKFDYDIKTITQAESEDENVFKNILKEWGNEGWELVELIPKRVKQVTYPHADNQDTQIRKSIVRYYKAILKREL